jgi:hypothetical protein
MSAGEGVSFFEMLCSNGGLQIPLKNVHLDALNLPMLY